MSQQGIRGFYQLTETIKEELLKDNIPDIIESVKVLRKRDHEYEPNRVKEE